MFYLNVNRNTKRQGTYMAHAFQDPSGLLIIKANFSPLLRVMEQKLDRIFYIGNLWLGRIILFKMSYLLQTLTVSIPSFIFHDLNKQMNFFGQNKKPRLLFSLITKCMRRGGLGLQNQQLCHIAIILEQIRYLLHRKCRSLLFCTNFWSKTTSTLHENRMCISNITLQSHKKYLKLYSSISESSIYD